ncbi:MAG: peptidoglycan DD-metalloendopeptidase family protein [Microbacterium sp.]
MRSIRALLVIVPTVLALVATATPAAAAPAPVALHVTTAKAVPAATVFRTPLKASYSVVSFYGPRCIPLRGASTWHLGVDLAARSGAGIYSIAAGVVTATVDGSSSRAGYIDVRHSIDGVAWFSRYYHIWDSTTRVEVGDVVKAGQRISEVGSSGVSGGPHLHLELWRIAKGGNVSTNPATFLKARGVALYADATAVTAKKAPATCTYYTTGAVNFRTGPSTSYSILRVLPAGTAVVHVPGKMTTGFLPVKVGKKSGWVSWPLVTPVKPATTTASTSSTTTTYKTTGWLNFRASPSMKGRIMLVIPPSTNVGTVKATSGAWRKIKYHGKTGWVHSSYLKKR